VGEVGGSVAPHRALHRTPRPIIVLGRRCRLSADSQATGIVVPVEIQGSFEQFTHTSAEVLYSPSATALLEPTATRERCRRCDAVYVSKPIAEVGLLHI
jgi:hypothetical protein